MIQPPTSSVNEPPICIFLDKNYARDMFEVLRAEAAMPKVNHDG
jgi:hypothetical protein